MNKSSKPSPTKARPFIYRAIMVGFLGVILSLLYVGLGRDYLFNWDEGIYAQLGVELRQSADPLVSTWNGELWLEKPPGIAYLSALGMFLFGQSEFGARALMPLFAGLTIWMVYRIGAKLWHPRAGIMAAALLASYNLFLSRARGVNTDGALLAAITTTYYLALTGASPWLVGLGISLGILMKGLAGLLVALIILPLLWRRGLAYLARVSLATLILNLPWHLYVYFRYGSAFYTPYFLEQVVRRTTVPIEFHLESRWYYFQFLGENLPGGMLGLALISLLITLGLFGYSLWKHRPRYQDGLALVWWVGVPLVIFTLAKTRLFWYILPIYPALALLITQLFVYLDRTRLAHHLITILIIGLCGQAILTVGQSVELHKKTAIPEARVSLAIASREYPGSELVVLVPHTERVAEAILPSEQRISSSFRYGGAPNLVFYARKPIRFYYNVDDWRQYLTSQPSLIILEQGDLGALPPHYVVISIQDNYLLAIHQDNVNH